MICGACVRHSAAALHSAAVEAGKALRSAGPAFAVDSSLVSNSLAEACVGAQSCVQRAMEGGEVLDQALQVSMSMMRLQSGEVGCLGSSLVPYWLGTGDHGCSPS